MLSLPTSESRRVVGAIVKILLLDHGCNKESKNSDFETGNLHVKSVTVVVCRLVFKLKACLSKLPLLVCFLHPGSGMLGSASKCEVGFVLVCLLPNVDPRSFGKTENIGSGKKHLESQDSFLPLKFHVITVH